MTTTHTPGPWHVAEGHEHSEDCPLNVWSSDGRIVAAIVGQGLNLLDAPTAEGAANARLIATAPRLLAALQACEELLAELERGGAENPELRLAREAIAAANGSAAP